jgi:hypothetical protein
LRKINLRPEIRRDWRVVVDGLVERRGRVEPRTRRKETRNQGSSSTDLLDGSPVVDELDNDLSLPSVFTLESLGQVFERLADGTLAAKGFKESAKGCVIREV